MCRYFRIGITMNDFDYDLFDDVDDMNPLYDDLYMPGANLWYDDDDIDDGVKVSELFELCIEPTTRDGFGHVGKLLLWCFLFRASTQLVEVPALLRHAVSAGTGLMVLHHFFRSTMYYIIGFAVLSYIILVCISCFMHRYRGPVIGIVSVSFLILSELFLPSQVEWHKIRGPQMLVAMKVISVAFDTDFGALQCLPSPAEFAGYVFCVGTCVFGPWVSYRDYVAIYMRPVWDMKWLKKILLNTLLAFTFLTLSTCWIQWLIPDGSWRWWMAYRDSFSFRSSHYFVSYLSEASAVVSGFGHNRDEPWSMSVTKPQFIEIPRSLVQVVVYWNIPMHCWLKNYIFRTAQPLGSFAAILSTYAVSSLLHGLNFQLAAVLLSLGAYTYVEYVLRQKLATIFGACIQVRPCKRDCSHRNKEKRLYVIFANVGFGVIAMLHLSYLGVMFDMSSKIQEEGYNYTHTLSKWSHLSYASHWVALGTYIFYLLI